MARHYQTADVRRARSTRRDGIEPRLNGCPKGRLYPCSPATGVDDGAAKRELMSAYGLPWSQARQYELDHLVPECAGESSDLRNLWPEPNSFWPGDGDQSSVIQNSKDRVEDYVCAALRERRIQLAAVQQAMANDWTTAVGVLGLSPMPTDYSG